MTLADLLTELATRGALKQSRAGHENLPRVSGESP